MSRARLGLRFFWDRAGEQPTHHTYHLASLVPMIARHWAKLPETDIKRLSEMATLLRPEVSGLSGRNMQRVLQLEDPIKLQSLLSQLLGCVLVLNRA